MQPMYYIGLDVHKRKISYCVKDSGGELHSEGSIPATRFDLDRWMKTLPQPWSAAMEATMSPVGSTIISSPMRPR
jgi:transposase